MQHFRAFLALAFATSLTFTSTAEARLTRLEISKRESSPTAWRSNRGASEKPPPRLVEADLSRAHDAGRPDRHRSSAAQ